MPAVTAERLGVQGQAPKAATDRGTRQLIGNHSYCICNLTLHYAVTLDQAVSGTGLASIIWRVRRQQWCPISVLFLVCS